MPSARVTGAPPVETTGKPPCLTRASAASTSRTTSTSVALPGSWIWSGIFLNGTPWISIGSTPVRMPRTRADWWRSLAPMMSKNANSRGFGLLKGRAPPDSGIGGTSMPKTSW